MTKNLSQDLLTWNAEDGEPVATIKITRRPDGGIRVWSPDVPGLVLSGSDPSRVMASVYPALSELSKGGAKRLDASEDYSVLRELCHINLGMADLHWAADKLRHLVHKAQRAALTRTEAKSIEEDAESREVEESAWGYQISGVGGRLVLVQDATRTDLVYAIKEQIDFLENLGILGERTAREVNLWRNGKKPSDLGDLQDQEPM